MEDGNTLHLINCESSFDSGQFLFVAINYLLRRPRPANEKESGSFQKLHSIIVNRKLLYTDKNWFFEKRDYLRLIINNYESALTC